MFNLNKYVLQEQCEGLGCGGYPDLNNPYTINVFDGSLTYEDVKYRLCFKRQGWTYVEILVKQRKTFLCIPYWKTVFYKGDLLKGGFNLRIWDVEKAKPKQCLKWFTKTFTEYLEYKSAWSEVR